MSLVAGPRRRLVAERLAAAGVPSPEVDARLLLRHADGEALERLVARREAREPLQLLLGSVGFRRLELEVRPGVFVPRPETELLVEAALEVLPPGGVVVEPCTGTGAVAIALATEGAPAAVHATDLSGEAVALARANAAAAGAEVAVAHGDLCDPLPDALRGQVDVIVANPPYVAAGELAACEPEVRDWDPAGALVAGPTGHEVTDRLLDEAPPWLAAGGWLVLETAEARAAEAADRARRRGWRHVAVRSDLTGRPRYVFASVGSTA